MFLVFLYIRKLINGIDMTSKIVILDLETSGIDINGNGIIEFRALTVDSQTGEVVSQFSQLTKPESPEKLPKLVEELTGINNDLLNSAIDNQEALQKFEEYVAGNQIWTYNLPFTSKFLKKIAHKEFDLNDILATARTKAPNLSGSRLESIATTMGIEVNQDLGRMKDCFIAKDILIKSLGN